VNRNAGAPTFVPDTYNPTEITEHFPTSVDIQRITLTDPDGDAVEMMVDYTQNKADYFRVNGDMLQLIKPLSEDPDKPTLYTVIINGNDMRDPKNPATNTATVSVRVNRNDFPPEFLNLPYTGSVTRNTANGTVVRRVSWRDNDLTAPYGEVTVSVYAGSGYAEQIFRLTNVVGNAGDIVVYNDQLLASDDAYEYTVGLHQNMFVLCKVKHIQYYRIFILFYIVRYVANVLGINTVRSAFI
jgi:hypothetical protein